jgi:hypothetical protein
MDEEESETTLPIQLHIRVGQPKRTSRVLRAISTPATFTIANDDSYEVLTAKVRTKLPGEGFEWPTQGPNSRLFVQPTANTSQRNVDELQEDDFFDQLLDARSRSRTATSTVNIYVWILKTASSSGRTIQRSSEARRAEATNRIAAAQRLQPASPPLGNLAHRHLVDRISRISNPTPEDFALPDTNTFRQARHLDQEADRLRARAQQQATHRQEESFEITISIGTVDIPIRINRVELLRCLHLPDMNLLGLLNDAGGVVAPSGDIEDVDHQTEDNGITDS